VITSPIWGATTPEGKIINFGLSRDLGDIINRANVGFDQSRGFCSVRGRNWRFPVLNDHCP
jgi:hypothetical protein